MYFVAALDVYLVLGSLLARAADPPCVWKYFVADSLPPIFIMRNCSHCQTVASSVSSCPSSCLVSLATYCRDWLSVQTRCALQGFGDSHCNPGRGRCRRVLMTTWDSLHGSQSISVHEVDIVSGRACGLERGEGGELMSCTLFAGFDLSFSKIFCDCVLVARAAMFAI